MTEDERARDFAKRTMKKHWLKFALLYLTGMGLPMFIPWKEIAVEVAFFIGCVGTMKLCYVFVQDTLDEVMDE